jgi:flavin-dependent dehydrogenase
MYDAIVVGARCGGAPTAMLLARAGLKVLLLDRNKFPSDIPHGHFIHMGGPRLLKAWGLLDRIVASGCPAVTRQITDFGDFPLRATELELDGVAWGYGPRRRVLDHILLAGAIEAGVEFRDHYLVEDFLYDGSAVVGVRGRDTQGAHVSEERAKITIGADGRNSRLARFVQAPAYDSHPPVACWYFSYWTDAESELFELYFRKQRAIFGFRTNDNLLTLFVGFPIDMFQQVRSNIKTHFLQALRLVPDLAARVQNGRQVERFYGTADLPNFFRKPFGPGWALVGDAGYHKDPFMALGIADAFRDAKLLADALIDGYSCRTDLNEALAGYEKQRNRAAAEEYRMNLTSAQFKPLPSEVLQIRAALRGKSEETRQYAMARGGMVSAEQFFNPENVQRLIGEKP